MENYVYCEQCDENVMYVMSHETKIKKVKDLTITLEDIPVPTCIECHNEVFVPNKSDQIQTLFFETYKKKKGLISVEEIKAQRDTLNISQKDFSKLLGLGEITISRYELGSIPNQANSTLIKSIKTRHILKQLFNQNKEKLTSKAKKNIQTYLFKFSKSMLKGNTNYNIDKFHELTAFFISSFEGVLYTTKLNKLMFYTDFLAFKKLKKSVTGSKYMKMSYGPVPNKYNFKYDQNPYLSVYELDPGPVYNINKTMTISHLSDKEIRIAKSVFNHFKSLSTTKISDLSHEEPAWLNTKQNDYISYDYAEDLIVNL